VIKPIDKYSAAHYIWAEVCQSWILADEEGLVVKQEEMPAGSREQLHMHHQARQFFYILSGVAHFYVNDEVLVVKEQQGLLILPGQKHYIANETNLSVSFLVISSPGTSEDRVNL
jgi:mannose-6-phosphate isomerase-like protein (cupin superfamily)